MRKLIVYSLVILAFSIGVAAQSGRIKQLPPSAVKPQTQAAQGITESKDEESVGFSESSPNAPRSIWTRKEKKEKKEKKPKKDSKKDTEQQTQTADAAQTDSSEPDEEVIKVSTNLVTIPVSIFDRNGLYIPNLRESEFKIFENGVEQEIAYFGTSEKPFTVVLLIDVSPSTAYKIEEIQQAANAFVNQLKPQDSVMVVQFDERVRVLTEPTNDREKISKAISKTSFGGGTSLYDAVDFSLGKRLSKIKGRKAIVLFTDGVDTTSNRASFESSVRDAEESEAMIFPIYYNTYLSSIGIGTGGAMSVPPTLGLPGGIGGIGGIGGRNNGSNGQEYKTGRAYLNELATATGGKVFRPESTPGGLTAAFEGIAEELRRQYSIGYYPNTEGAAGERKQIRVRVNRPKLIIRARDSYIVGANESTK